MKKIKLFNLLSTSLVCSSLLMTAPVSAAEAHRGHLSPNSQMPIEKKESVIPNTTTSFVLTKNNQKQTVDDTVKYIENQGIKVKSVVPEIGWIETDRTNQHQEKKIEKDTHADVQTPDNQANNSYTPTAIPSRSTFNSPVNKYFWNRQWNMHMMTQNPDNYVNDTQSHVKIGIIDSGITDEYRHQLGSRIRYAENFVPRGGFNYQDYDESGNPSDTNDRIGHGTSVTSLIVGTDKMVGVNSNATIDEYRVFSQKGCSSSWVLKALIKAVNNGDDVINLSLGRYGLLTGGYLNGRANNDMPEYQAWTRAVQYAKQHGSTVVVAAGNESINLNDPQAMTDYINKNNSKLHAVGQGVSLPASIPGIIQVAATGNQGERAEYSCYSKDSVYAPGGDSNRTGIHNPNQAFIPTDWLLTYGGHGTQYNFGIGTSFAAPEVTGMIAHEISKNNLYGQSAAVITKLRQSLETNNHGLPCVILDKLINDEHAPATNDSSRHSSSSSSSSSLSSSSSRSSDNFAQQEQQEEQHDWWQQFQQQMV